MSLYDYRKALELSKEDPPFASLIMAAMLKADTDNTDKLSRAWPEIRTELDRRYNSRLALETAEGQLIGGALPEDLSKERPHSDCDCMDCRPWTT